MTLVLIRQHPGQHFYALISRDAGTPQAFPHGRRSEDCMIRKKSCSSASHFLSHVRSVFLDHGLVILTALQGLVVESIR